ncbi:MAG: hypothetical protein E3J64_07470 [Anaerolineales bacterium]|nr:MAG: hypothetical protein E3J64_07470 [Anaerolineales bacterium]
MAIVLSVAGGAYIGLLRGERVREQEIEELAAEHYGIGVERLQAEDYGRARAEFTYVLDLDPNHELAQQGLAAAEAGIAALPTPTVETYEVVAADLYAEAVDRYEAEDWQEAATTLIQLRKLDAEHEVESVEEMLFTSLYNAGMALLEADRMEEGVFYLDQAAALRPLDAEATVQRDLAARYITALGLWGADWESCIHSFAELYDLAPNYRDVAERLRGAQLAYADAWYLLGEMCPAEDYYSRALKMGDDEEISEKRDAATEYCAVATPTPIVSVAGTHVITLTEIPEGFNYGRLAYPVYNAQTYSYDVWALFADGRLMGMAADADQPCWVWSNGTLGFRDLSAFTPGLSMIVPGEDGPRQLMQNGSLASPTFSPDGARVAYASYYGGGDWRILIAPVDGSEDPIVHAEGKGPAWGPSRLLARTG